MKIPYDLFVEDFLSKITERDLLELMQEDRNQIVFGYMKRAINVFNHVCKYNLKSFMDGDNECFDSGDIDIPDDELSEIVDIVSEGMVVQWLKPYVYRQELLENTINTRDFTTYSPAELLMRIGSAYKSAQKDFTQMVREYSFNYGDLSDLHL